MNSKSGGLVLHGELNPASPTGGVYLCLGCDEIRNLFVVVCFDSHFIAMLAYSADGMYAHLFCTECRFTTCLSPIDTIATTLRGFLSLVLWLGTIIPSYDHTPPQQPTGWVTMPWSTPSKD